MPDFSANEKSLLLINSPNMDKMKGIPNNPKIPIVIIRNSLSIPVVQVNSMMPINEPTMQPILPPLPKECILAISFGACFSNILQTTTATSNLEMPVFALKFLLERIQEDYGIESFEGYFIFDADNLLKKDYIISKKLENILDGQKMLKMIVKEEVQHM